MIQSLRELRMSIDSAMRRAEEFRNNEGYMDREKDLIARSIELDLQRVELALDTLDEIEHQRELEYEREMGDDM